MLARSRIGREQDRGGEGALHLAGDSSYGSLPFTDVSLVSGSENGRVAMRTGKLSILRKKTCQKNRECKKKQRDCKAGIL